MLRSDTIRLKPSRIRLSYFRGIIQGGLPSLARQGLASVATACLNHAVGLFLLDGVMIDAVQAAMTGVSKITLFMASALIGFGQGFQPVCGFNYGAKKYDRVLDAFFFCVKTAAVALVIFSVVGYVFAVPITDAVAGSTALSAEIAAFTFRTQLVVFPLQAWVMLCNMMLQNINPRKWICVEANDIAAAIKGDLVMFIMLDTQLQMTAGEMVNAFSQVAGGVDKTLSK
jgi:Na+-driven multidrug efflux pump